MRARAILLLLASSLAACAVTHGPDAAPTAGDKASVVIYDVSGRPTVLSVVPKSAPADEAGSAAAGAPASGASASFQGESYRSVDEVDAELQTRQRDRFYLVPDAGPGRTPVLTAGQIGADPDHPRLAPPPGPPLAADFLRCPAPVRIEGLVGGNARGHEASVEFPIRMGSAVAAGYAVLFPRPLARLNVWSVLRGGGPPVDVVVTLLDDRNRVVAVVNNFATETVPESLFRYGKVGGGIDLTLAPLPVQGVAVLDARSAARWLPAACLPALPATPVGEGRVMMTWRVAESSKR